MVKNKYSRRCLPAVIIEAQNGNSVAFAQVYGLYKHQVFALCLRMTKNPVESEDLTQEIFLQVFRKMNSFRGEAAFATWLYTVARNVVLMHIRRRCIETVPGDVSEIEELSGIGLPRNSNVCLEPLGRLALKRAIGSLPKHRRNVLILHDIEGLSHREVGSRLGVEAGTSKSQLHYAHLALRGETWRLQHRAE